MFLCLFKELQMDGITVSEDCYTLALGSTIVTLKNSYLSSLSEGTHTLKFIYEDEAIETTLKVSVETQDDDANTNSNPKTGDIIMFYVSI